MNYEKMKKNADLIVIAQPISVKITDEKKKLNDLHTGTHNFKLIVIGVETIFKCKTLLKGSLTQNESKFVLHHYRLAGQGERISNGPSFISFDTVKRKTFIMFLKKEKDGRYAPVSGQFFPDFSIVRLGTSISMDLESKNKTDNK